MTDLPRGQSGSVDAEMVASEELSADGRGQQPLDLTGVILGLLDQRAAGATICPSDAARAAFTGTGDGWRALMQPVRDAAAALADDGRVEVTQGGQVVDVRTARGPVRIRRRTS